MCGSGRGFRGRGSRWMGHWRRMRPGLAHRAGSAGLWHGSAARQMRLMEHLSRHLEERGLAVADLTGQVAGGFLAGRRAGAHSGTCFAQGAGAVARLPARDRRSGWPVRAGNRVVAGRSVIPGRCCCASWRIKCGLTSAFGAAPGRKGKFPLIDRRIALVLMAVAIALGVTSISNITMLAHQEPVFGPRRPIPRCGGR